MTTPVVRRTDYELRRMIEAVPVGIPRGEYIEAVVAIVRRHNAALLATLERKEILIDHLNRIAGRGERYPTP